VIEAAVSHHVCLALAIALALPVLFDPGLGSAHATALSARAPALIVGDGNFTAANGVIGGDGTPPNPYLIEGWDIDASTAHGIEIRDTTASFAIRNVSVHSGGTSHFGIYLFNVSRGQVHNATSFGNWFGLALDQSDNVSIALSNFSANLQTGLNLRLSSGVSVTGNQVSSNVGAGIFLFQVSGATVANNSVFSNQRSGIAMDRSTDLAIADNLLVSNQDTGVDVKDSPRAEVRRNTFLSDGLFLYDSLMPEDVSSYTITADNLVNGKPLRYYRDCSGLDVDGIVAGQVIVGNCTNVRIANMAMSDTDVGVEVLFSSDIVIQANRVTNGLFGAWIDLSSNATITGNNLSSNSKVGLELFAVLNAEILGNVIASSETGLLANFGSSWTVAENDVRNNAVGVSFSQVSGSRVYHNNLVANTVQARDNAGAANAWDDGYPSGGNYWSDFAGQDLCSGPAQDVCPDPDGVGDTPYAIDADSQDRYPLFEAFAPNNPPVASFTVSPTSGTVATVFQLDASASSDAEDPPGALRVRWDWEADGVWDTPRATAKTAQHQYAQPGSYTIRLEVLDTDRRANTTSVPVTVSAGDTSPPVIQHAPLGAVAVGQPIVVEANVEDAGGVQGVLLFYRGVDDPSVQSVPMTPIGGGAFRAILPAQGRPGTLEYHIEATDTAGNTARSPASGEHTVAIREAPSTFPLEIAIYLTPVVAVVLALILLLYRRRKRPSGGQPPPTGPR